MKDKEPNSSDPVKLTTSSQACIDDYSIWKNLTSWVQKKHGGLVHQALHMETTNNGSNRGVIASRPIDQGELLIRLPSSCILSGRTLLHKPDYAKSLRQKSSWMQCVSSFYLASSSNENDNWKPYLDSLPQTYETLFQWSNEEIKTYLKGTTLGAMVLADRTEDSMKTRYQTAVRPVLDELKLLGQEKLSEDDEMKMFLNACMCISTRGFHYSGEGHDEEESYKGPFLLPIIDMLNHNPSKSCTTLQYSEGCFSMVAERPIAQGEEILHSYGDSLTSAQLLQTFGFVMVPPLPSTAEIGNHSKMTPCLTPASLSKSKHLIPACQAMKQSGIPKRLQSKLIELNNQARGGMEEDEEESWEVSDLPIRDEDGILSEDVLIDCNQEVGSNGSNESSSTTDQHQNDDETEPNNNNKNNNHKGLTDELITWMCFQFLPSEAYEELICDDNGNHNKVTTLLDASILEDLYLGILVCRSLLLALNKKLDDYDDENENDDERHETTKQKEPCLCETTNAVVNRLESLLAQEVPPKPPSRGNSVTTTGSTTTIQERAQYGWTVRQEELSNLKVLAIQVSCIMKCLYEELKKGGEIATTEEPNAKRAKMEAE
ncbi:unnamed protein product [Cylindrotheca closterium]|uniref:SET domain-containing protein n=1 Tax=Cylindrotheca closterium TaxID=2856 RepID=A0AAD2CKY9_9STRA|nr:unnamed protein product [Cylindrotheca closterium]